jgi:hypothetical protein
MIAGAVLASACGAEIADGRTMRDVDGIRVFVAEIPECDDGGACSAAYIIDGVLYEPIDKCSEAHPTEGRPLELFAVMDAGTVRRFFRGPGTELVAQVTGSDPRCHWQRLRPSVPSS